MPSRDLSNPDDRADLWAVIGEHSDPEFLEVVVPFMRWLMQRPPDEIKQVGEAIIALSALEDDDSETV